jgi:hypothetical protein
MSDPLVVRGLILISPQSHTIEHTRSPIERLFRLAEAGDMSTQTDLFLCYVLPSAFLAYRGQEIECLRALAMEQNAKAVGTPRQHAWHLSYRIAHELPMHQAG